MFQFGGTLESPWFKLEGDAAESAFQVAGGLLALLGLAAAGILAYFVYRNQMELLAIGVAAIAGTLTNTILVLTMIVVRGYLPADVAWTIGLTHGIPEIIVAVIVTVAVVAAWKRIETGRGKSSV
ncbi:MAG: ECF transporter S component [Chloroflexota bacterium]